MINFEQVMLLIGKLHPMVVHFPIALLLLAALLEIFFLLKGSRAPSSHGKLLVVIGATFAVIAAVFGWINAANQEFSGDLEQLLFLHRWLGVAVAVSAVVAAVLACIAAGSLNRKIYLSYIFTLTLTAGILSAGSHYGGLIVFGEEYFAEVFDGSASDGRASLGTELDTEAGETSELGLAQVSSGIAPGKINFLRDVRPILKRSCYRCHGGGQDKGEFRLDTRELFINGGENGPAVVVGNAKESYLIDLVTAKNPKEAMPNKGRRLSPAEIEVLRAWINQGLPWGDQDGGGSIENPLELRAVTLPQEEVAQFSSGIDRLILTYFKKHSISPPTVVSDRIFARRVFLDTIGRFPSVKEIKSFEEDRSPAKREELVGTLLSDSHAYARHWLSFWNDHLRNDYSGTGFLGGGRKQITAWLYQSLLKNKPYDQFVSELISPNKRSDGFIKGIVWKGDINPNERPEMQASQNIAQIFLGVNLKCASCHDSFTDSWTLEDAYGLANVYAKEPLQTHDCDRATGEIAPARFIYPQLGAIPKELAPEERMEALADLMVDRRNGAFARTITNRIWKRLLGYGLNEPVDQVDGPGWYAELHDWLSKDFIESNYDLKLLIQKILTSNAYQLPAVLSKEMVSSLPGSSFKFAGPVIRPVYAEQQIDSVRELFGVSPPFGASDFDRILKLTEKDSGIIKHTTRTLFPNGDRVEIDVDLSGLNEFWLVVTNGRKAKDSGDKSQEDQAPKKIAESSCYVYSPYLEIEGKVAALEQPSAIEIVPNSTDLIASTEKHTFLTRPFRAMRFALPGVTSQRIKASLSAGGSKDAPAPKRGGSCQFFILSTLNLDASMLEFTPLLEAFGRPLRDQVVSARETQLTSIRAMAFQNRTDIAEYFKRIAGRVLERFSELSDREKNREIVAFVYESMLARAPSEEESRVAEQALSLGSQGLEDLLWSVILSPEVQYIL